MNNARPKNLNLCTIRMPLPAIVSILHRISGLFLFFCIPLMLWTLEYSFTYEGYDVIQQWLSTFWVKFIFWLLLAAFCYHLVAGVRHLLSDFLQIGESKKGGKFSAMLTLVITGLLVILAGVWLW